MEVKLVYIQTFLDKGCRNSGKRIIIFSQKTLSSAATEVGAMSRPTCARLPLSRGAPPPSLHHLGFASCAPSLWAAPLAHSSVFFSLIWVLPGGCLPAMQKTWVRSLGWEDPLEKEMATPSSILAWRIPWTEEPGGLQSTGLQRVGHDRATSLSLYLSALQPAFALYHLVHFNTLWSSL